VRANRAYHLIHTRGNLRPALFAGDERLDLIEVVSVNDGEVQLFWELPARLAMRMLRTLRTDLASLDSETFIARWQDDAGRR
jgi:hypothetical protein